MENIYNAPFAAAVAAWFIAQIVKNLCYFFRYRKVRLDRFLGAGGMPSSHSSAVCALASAVAITEGIDSASFALAAILAMVVMYDASGVRRAAGMHAREINRIKNIVEELETETATTKTRVDNSAFEEQEKEISIKEKTALLKEFLGHSPLEVFLGAFLGITVGILMTIFM